MYQSVQKDRPAKKTSDSPMRCFRKGRIADDLDLLTSICLVAPDAAEVGGDLRPTPLSFRTMAEGMLGRDLLLTPPPPVIPLRSSTLWCEGLWLARLRGWVWGVLGVGPDGPVDKEQMFATRTYFCLRGYIFTSRASWWDHWSFWRGWSRSRPGNLYILTNADHT